MLLQQVRARFSEKTMSVVRADPSRNIDNPRPSIFIDYAEDGRERLKEVNANDIADVWNWYAKSPAAAVLRNTDTDAMQTIVQCNAALETIFQESNNDPAVSCAHDPFREIDQASGPEMF